MNALISVVKLRFAAYFSVLLLGFSGHVAATEIRLDFTANLSFDPNGLVAAGGIDAEDLIDEIYGPGFGSAGSVEINGNLTYESNTPIFRQTPLGSAGAAADFFGLVIEASVSLDGSNPTADMALINGSAPNFLYISGVGNGSTCFGAIFAVLSNCGSAPVVGASNAGIVLNDSPVNVVGPGGIVMLSERDTLGFVLGGTNASPEFSPLFSTGVVGDVWIEGLSFIVLGVPGEDLWNDLLLPDSESFFQPSLIDSAPVELILAGPNLTGPFVLSGEATALSVEIVDSNPGGPGGGSMSVPEPQTLVLFSLGILGIGITARKNKG